MRYSARIAPALPLSYPIVRRSLPAVTLPLPIWRPRVLGRWPQSKPLPRCRLTHTAVVACRPISSFVGSSAAFRPSPRRMLLLFASGSPIARSSGAVIIENFKRRHSYKDGGSADQAHHSSAAGDAANFDPRPTFAGTRNARGHAADQRATALAACAAGFSPQVQAPPQTRCSRFQRRGRPPTRRSKGQPRPAGVSRTTPSGTQTRGG